MGGDESTAGQQATVKAPLPDTDVRHTDQPMDTRLAIELQLDQLLLPVVKARIVPRLLLNFDPASLRSSRQRACPADELIDELVEHLLKSDIDSAQQCVEQMQLKEANPGLAVLDLFTQTARVLGRRWDTDDSSFADVTIAMSHLSALLRYTSNLTQASGHLRRSVRMMMATLPGDQHSFGLTVAAEHFSRVGFDVLIFDDTAGQSILDCLSTQAYDVVGLSLGHLRHRQALTDLIVQIRTVSLNREVGIIVGGPHFIADQALGQLVGADLIVDNLHEGTADVLALLDWLRESRTAEESLLGQVSQRHG